MRKELLRVLVLSVALVLGGVGCARSPVVAIGEVAAVGQASRALEPLQLGEEVTPKVVAELVADGEVAVIDVREDWEYEEGHILGAKLIPLASLQDRVDEIPTDKPVILVCRSGNRSGQAYRYLSGAGFDNVHNMRGGMIAWEASGLEMAP
ncbi:MAG: rhodanese-like domain-containing protein [Anaerolineae bacterium]|nr:rhodanese-like domain-containing protein [Anaerolineae bacterium]